MGCEESKRGGEGRKGEAGHIRGNENLRNKGGGRVSRKGTHNSPTKKTGRGLQGSLRTPNRLPNSHQKDGWGWAVKRDYPKRRGPQKKEVSYAI